MNSNPWLEKAERLRATLASVSQDEPYNAGNSPHERETLERVAIAHWLRQEFSDDLPEDTSTLPLFFNGRS